MNRLSVFIVLFLVFAPIANTYSSDISGRRKELISVIDEELKEITRLNKNIGGKDPNLLLRMAELLLEKARHIKDAENEKYLALSTSQRQKAKKSSYFKRSTKYFKQAQKTCYYILKRFPNFSGKSDVYYILAYNAKEFRQEKRAKKFFLRAAKTSKKKSNTGKRSKIALAEIYYNQKNYRKAIPLYEQALKYKDQKWWTKDSFNLAWSYFRAGQKAKAISKMREIYKLKNNPKFVNMDKSVERDLAYFYADSGRINEAVSFYREINKDIANNLLKVGKYLKGQGNFTSAEKALSEARKYVKDANDEVKINIELLSLYQRFGKERSHLAASKTLKNHTLKGNLTKEQVDVLIYHVKNHSARLQKQVVSKTYRSQRKVRRRKANLAVEYFKILVALDKKNEAKHYFHIAETYFADKNFNLAMSNYDKAMELAKAQGNSEIQKLALDGMMASLGNHKVAAKSDDKYLIRVYTLYLTRYPKGKKANRIYQRLFNVYYEKKNIKAAEKTLYAYRSSYPKNWKIQEAMLAKVIDFYKARADKAAIKTWVERINAREFVVSKKVAEKLRALLLTMQFEGVEKASSRGDKKKALKLYVAIYKSPGSNVEAKKNAAYNIAVLFHALDNVEHTYRWAKQALDLMNANDVQKFESSFLLMASGLYSRQRFDESSEIFEKTLSKVCSKRVKNKSVFFKNAIVISLANGDIQRSERVFSLRNKCSIRGSIVKEAHLDILKYLIDHKHWSKANIEFKSLLKNQRASNDLIEPAQRIGDAFRSSGQNKIASWYYRKVDELYSDSRKKRRNIPLRALDIIAAKRVAKLERDLDNLKSIRLSFPEQKYNKQLKNLFGYLDRITASGVNILKIRSGKGITEAYTIMIKGYEYVGNEIQQFTPPGKGPDYIKSFKASMKELVSPVLKKAVEYKREAKRQIMVSDILSIENFELLKSPNSTLTPFYYSRYNGVTMDRGGKK